jgi:hypothetical protein
MSIPINTINMNKNVSYDFKAQNLQMPFQNFNNNCNNERGQAIPLVLFQGKCKFN